MIEFLGMTPWVKGSEIIECASTMFGNVDLHNECDLDGVLIWGDSHGRLCVTLKFRALESDVDFALSLNHIHSLAVKSDEISGPFEPTLLVGIDYFDLDAEEVIVVRTGAIEMELSPEIVAFEGGSGHRS